MGSKMGRWMGICEMCGGAGEPDVGQRKRLNREEHFSMEPRSLIDSFTCSNKEPTMSLILILVGREKPTASKTLPNQIAHHHKQLLLPEPSQRLHANAEYTASPNI